MRSEICGPGDEPRWNERRERAGWDFGLIGMLKLLTALLLAAAGFGIFRLLDRNLGEVLEHFASRLHLDPENRLVHEAIYRAAGIDHTHLKSTRGRARSSTPPWKAWRGWACCSADAGPST